MVRRLATNSLYVTGLLAWAAGCSAVLGIEDLGANPPLGKADSGSGGDESGGSAGAGAKGSGGSSNGGGGTSAGGASAGGGSSGGSGGDVDGSVGDSSVGGGGTGGVGSGGASGAGGGGAGGSPADAGAPVTGTVIDYWGHKIKNVPVTIGSNTVKTDTNGKFTIPDVPPTYDVTLVISFPNYLTTSGWIFQDLTRRDPTLQVYEGMEYTSGDIAITLTGPTLPIPTSQTYGFSFGSPDGKYVQNFDDFYFTSPTDTTDDVYPYWHGGATTTGNAHSLLWTKDATTGFPTAYNAYDVHTALTADSAATTPLAVNLKAASPALAVGNISGTVTSTATSRENAVYVRFLDGAAIQVVDDTSPSNSFLYKVPTLTNGGITLAAVDGSLGYSFPVAIAHVDDLAASQTNISLTTPTPMSLTGPVDGATGVNATTKFQWSGPATVSLLTINIIDASGTVGDQMFVVTDKKTLNIPTFPLSFSIAPGSDCRWFIETHGDFASVDEVAGPTGFLDTFAYGEPEGLRRGKGTYTDSEVRQFTTAP